MVTSAAPVSDDEKRACLDAALSSVSFARSAQLKALLRYICEREMAGRAEDLTEYQIAVDVLGRRKDVDFGDDASVRNRAYELRQRLERYYTTERPAAEIRIEIPRGGYVPFYTRQAAVPAAAQARTEPASRRKFPWIGIGLVLAVLVLATTILLLVWPSPRPSSILKEAWGPLADPSGDLLVVIATNMHMLVRPHIAPHSKRLPAPDEVYPLYAPRPLAAGTPLYMEPATLSVPLAGGNGGGRDIYQPAHGFRRQLPDSPGVGGACGRSARPQRRAHRLRDQQPGGHCAVAQSAVHYRL
jgi:hypothetical protein